jgi:flagellar hook-length control protein FliK
MARLDVAALIPAPSPPVTARAPARRTDSTDAFNAFLKSARSRRDQATRAAPDVDSRPSRDTQSAKVPSDDRPDEPVDRDAAAVASDAAATQTAPQQTPAELIAADIVDGDPLLNSKPIPTDPNVASGAHGQATNSAPAADGVTDVRGARQVNGEAVATTPRTHATVDPGALIESHLGRTAQSAAATVHQDSAVQRPVGPAVEIPTPTTDAAPSEHLDEDGALIARAANNADESATDEADAARAQPARESDKRSRWPVNDAQAVDKNPRGAVERQPTIAAQQPAVQRAANTRQTTAPQDASLRESSNVAADPRLENQAQSGNGDESASRHGDRRPVPGPAALRATLDSLTELDTTETDLPTRDPAAASHTSDFAARLSDARSFVAPAQAIGAVPATNPAASNATTAPAAGGANQVGSAGVLDDPTPVPIDRFANVVRTHIEGDRWQVRLQLDPPDLGKVRLDVNMKQDGLHVRMHVAGEEVRKLVESRMRELVDGLRDHDIKVSQTTVTVRGAAQSGNENATDSRESSVFQHDRPQDGGGRANSDAGARHDSNRGDAPNHRDAPDWRGDATTAGAPSRARPIHHAGLDLVA